jgi:zinc/manganese transport system ATP-binding protein
MGAIALVVCRLAGTWVSANMTCTALKLIDVTIAYHGHPAVHHVSGCFDKGSLTAIVGPNGAGKSTLLGAMAGLTRINQGTIELDQADVQHRHIAFLRQLSGINQDFPLRVLEVVAMGAWQEIGAWGSVKGAVLKRIEAALAQVALQGFEDRLIDELSVGQLQRALFARLIVQDAPIILLDEPFNALDATTTADLLKVIHTWHASGRTVIAVLHDLTMVREHFPQTLLMARELIAWGNTTDVLTTANLARAQAHSLAWQDTASWCHVPGTLEAAAIKPHRDAHHHG